MKKAKVHTIKNIGPIKIPATKQKKSNYAYTVIDGSTTNKHLSNKVATSSSEGGSNSSGSNQGQE